MNSYRNLWLKHLWVCVSVLGLAGCGESSLSFRAVDGVLDLREWDITTQPKVPLAGEWAYRWGELLSPQRIQSNLHAPLEATINVPEFWNGLPDPYQADKVLSSHGHMTLACCSDMCMRAMCGDIARALQLDMLICARTFVSGPCEEDENSVFRGTGVCENNAHRTVPRAWEPPCPQVQC